MLGCAPLLARVAGVIPRGVYQSARARVAPWTSFSDTGIASDYFVVARARVQACDSRPCDRVLIEGHVQAQQQTVAGGPSTTIPTWDDDAYPSAIPLKLRVQRCEWPGWVSVDSDSHVTMPGGQDLEVQVIAPTTWVTLPGPELSPLPIPAWTVQAKVRACLVEGRTPPEGRLTYIFDATAGPAAPTMGVPRRANGFHMYSVAGTGPAIEAVDAGTARSNVQGNAAFSQAKQTIGAWAIVQPQLAFLAGTIVWGID